MDRGAPAERASDLFEAGLSRDRALLGALRRCVPDFADWCVVDYYAADGELTAVHSGYPDPAKEALILEIRRRYRAERGENGDVLAALESGVPLLYPHMDQIASVRLSAAEAKLLDELGLKSSVVVPMHSGGAPLGVVSFVSMSRRYDETDLAAAQEFAAGCARVLIRLREEGEVRRSLALLDALFGAAPVGLGFVDPGLQFRGVNEHLAELDGVRIEDHLGRTPAEVLGDLGRLLAAHCRRALDHGAPEADVELAAATATEPGVTRDWLVSCARVTLDHRVLGVSCVVQEITARKRAEARSAFLARAGEILDSSLDYRQTLRRVARLAVPDVADWCSISMRGERGQMHRLAVAHFDPVRDRLAQELIEREALPSDDARLYTEHSRIAHTLQAGLLPHSLPTIPGVELAARYRPTGELNEVGGDFYDVYLRSAGEWIVVIGDVTGKGAEAAATTALIRYTLRAAALRPGSAGELLGELNRAMVAQEATFCTVALVSIRPAASGAAELSPCVAGHPLPLLLQADGGSRAVAMPGTMLGYVEHPELIETRVELEPGDILLLYTDGLTEAEPPGWTDAGLRDRLRTCTRDDLAALLAQLEAAAVAAAAGNPRDDIALLALRAAP